MTPSAKPSRVSAIIAIVLHDRSGNGSDGPIISARERVFVAGVPRPLERGYSRKAHLDEAHHVYSFLSCLVRGPSALLPVSNM